MGAVGATGPLHGPPTFEQWLRTCSVEVFLDGPAWTVEAELTGLAAELTVEMLPGNEFTRVTGPADPAPDALQVA